MLESVPIRDLKPNPFRRLDEYPIQRHKVDSLKQSIAATGFWGTIVARRTGDHYEIAFGHHRMVALRELFDGDKSVEIIARPLSNEQMLQMMARENMEEWGTSAWIELETIRAVIDAYGGGWIKLPEIPARARRDIVRYVSPGSGTHPYTKGTVAQFLGWTKKHHDGLQPNNACETAFKALDLIAAGYLKESDLCGLTRTQMAELVEGAAAIRRAHEREARGQREAAERAKRRAVEADEAKEKRRYEKWARILEDQARWAEADAREKPKQFAATTAEQLRQGEGVRIVRAEAERYKPSTNGSAIPSVDRHGLKIVGMLSGFGNGEDRLSAAFRLLKSVDPADLSARVADEIDAELGSLIRRLEVTREQFKKFRVH